MGQKNRPLREGRGLRSEAQQQPAPGGADKAQEIKRYVRPFYVEMGFVRLDALAGRITHSSKLERLLVSQKIHPGQVALASWHWAQRLWGSMVLPQGDRGRLLTGRIPGVNKDVSRIIYGTLFLHTFESDDVCFELLDGVWSAGCNAFDCAAI